MCIGAVCMWIWICTEVLPQKSDKTSLLVWPCNVFIRNVHAQYSSAFRHTTVILEIDRNRIISLVWEKSTLFPQVLNWCIIQMKEGVIPVPFLSTTDSPDCLFRLVLSLKVGRAFYRYSGMFVFSWRLHWAMLLFMVVLGIVFVFLCNYTERSFRIHVFFLPKIALYERAQFICDP